MTQPDTPAYRFPTLKPLFATVASAMEEIVRELRNPAMEAYATGKLTRDITFDYGSEAHGLDIKVERDPENRAAFNVTLTTLNNPNGFGQEIANTRELIASAFSGSMFVARNVLPQENNQLTLTIHAGA